MSRRKLVYVATEDWYFVSHRLALAEAARDAGYDVSVVTNVAQHGEKIAKAGLTIIPLPFVRSSLDPWRETGTLAALTRIYRRIRPDVVHHVALKPVVYGALAARAANVPRVVSAVMGLGFVFASDSAKARFLRPALRVGLRQAFAGAGTRIIVQNQDDRDQLVAERLADPKRIRLIRGSGVDINAFTPSPLPAGRPRIVLPARMLRYKGVGDFIAAARICKANGLDAEFILAGAPDSLNPASLTDAELQALAAEGTVTYLGWRDDMTAVIRDATIVCLPSYYREGLPKSLLEAAASARAIVATDVAGCREIVRHGVNGLLVPPRDPEALSVALTSLLKDPARCAAFGAAGRRMVEEEFSLPRVIAETLSVYSEP